MRFIEVTDEERTGEVAINLDQARNIHEDFYWNFRDENQNSLRYSFFAPGSYKGRSTSQAR